MIGLNSTLLGGIDKLSAKTEAIKNSTSNLNRPLNSILELGGLDKIKKIEQSMDSIQTLDLPITDKKDAAEIKTSDTNESHANNSSKESYTKNIAETRTYDNVEAHTLTGPEKEKIKKDLGWSDKVIDNCKVKDDGVIIYPCRNKDMAGKKNSLDVNYKKRIENIHGYKVEIVTPIFPSVFQCKLSEALEKASDREQFKECNQKLNDALQKNPILRLKFSKEQIAQIQEGTKTGKAPNGYVWHHDCQTGKMILVDKKTHTLSGHTGGKALWGGGEDYRK